MKIISLNVRGFSVKGKFGWVRNICVSKRPCIAVFQETKCKTLSDSWVQSLWGDTNYGYVQKEVVSKSRGLLVIWDTSKFEIIDATSGDFFVAIRGKWRLGEESIIVNIYGPHSDKNKKLMWDSLDNLLNSVDSAWLPCGDFNEVRYSSDRKNSQFHRGRAKRFNEFIGRNNLIDIAISGRKFTRISDDGLKFSKLDRFLVNVEFINLWEDLSAIALDRNLSDHCPLVLHDKLIDYGPKPFKVFDEWLNCEEIDKVIRDAWQLPIRGSREDCIFRDRLKNVKVALRSWSNSRYGGLDGEIKELKKETME
ncbi:uncharacterized protein [Rutidosis leptorrhynchoides]|uniref:uncharacterized protein n=1 Tax=Rutidosis leptorrhynchoides TaxID=125765 RepID=UPI003A9906E5